LDKDQNEGIDMPILDGPNLSIPRYLKWKNGRWRWVSY